MFCHNVSVLHTTEHKLMGAKLFLTSDHHIPRIPIRNDSLLISYVCDKLITKFVNYALLEANALGISGVAKGKPGRA